MLKSHIFMRFCLPGILLCLSAISYSNAETTEHTTSIKEDFQNIGHEIIPLKDGRFLMWRDEMLAYQAAVTGVIIRIEDGVPNVDTTYMEMFDEGSNTVSLSNVVAFGSLNQHFDPHTSILTFDSKDGYVATYQHTYFLKGDRFVLLKLIKSQFVNCKPDHSCDTQETLLYEAKHHAKPQ